MRNLNRRDRVRVIIPAVVAAIVPSILLLPHPSGDRSDFVRGGIVGVLIGISLVALIGPRFICRNKNAS